MISALERMLGGLARTAEWLDTPNSDLDGRGSLDDLSTTIGVERRISASLVLSLAIAVAIFQ